MSMWRLDPGAISRVLADVDDAMSVVPGHRDNLHSAEDTYATELEAGRDTVTSAWKKYMGDRHNVPDDLMRVVQARVDALITSVTELIESQTDMAQTFEVEESAQEWEHPILRNKDRKSAVL